MPNAISLCVLKLVCRLVQTPGVFGAGHRTGVSTVQPHCLHVITNIVHIYASPWDLIGIRRMCLEVTVSLGLIVGKEPVEPATKSSTDPAALVVIHTISTYN
ncbi:hypothetical protein HYFRA_00008353 [Hymenoscyphus fraxineus]|uniref:Secreted protein n=1 Tax=Hymenoscyphus fraxineus TaxID=746836 RepID=A0A9N9KNC7_9HELO|nr:hypothetical protein HYFRA_00008353 [Hymenoscyphus fraxineus]